MHIHLLFHFIGYYIIFVFLLMFALSLLVFLFLFLNSYRQCSFSDLIKKLVGKL